MTNRFLSDDRGSADLQSTMITVFITLALMGAATVATVKIIPQFNDDKLVATMLAMAAEHQSAHTDTNRYLPQESLTNSDPKIVSTLSNNAGCYTLIGAASNRVLILESNQQHPTELLPDTTATCIGESRLKLQLIKLGLPSTGRTGQEVLSPVTGITSSGGTLSWAPSHGATGYSVAIERDGVPGVVSSTTSPSLPFSAAAGSTVKFIIKPTAEGTVGTPSEFVQRFEPASKLVNHSFEGTGGWTSVRGFWSSAERNLCAGVEVVRAGTLQGDFAILSSAVAVTPGQSINVYAESCGPVVPVYEVTFAAADGTALPDSPVGTMVTTSAPTIWDSRTTPNIKVPVNAATARVTLMHSGATGMLFLDDVDILRPR